MDNPTFLSAQVQFLNTELLLIHIPLELYHTFIQPILQLILPHEQPPDPHESDDEFVRRRLPWAYDFPFVNVSVTPVECSVVCPRHLAEKLFQPIITQLGADNEAKVTVSQDIYIPIQVDGEGLDAGQRVLELTNPLAMNGISIFFITTYFSDFILVPLHSRAVVISALEKRGFAFESTVDAFANVSSPLLQPTISNQLREQSNHVRNSSSHSMDSPTRPMDVPNAHQQAGNAYSFAPQNNFNGNSRADAASHVKTYTFSTLAQLNVKPIVDPSIQLIQCTGRKDGSSALRGDAIKSSMPAKSTLRLQLGLVKCLVAIPRPRFFSVTLTDSEPASLLLQKEHVIHFTGSDPNPTNSASELNAYPRHGVGSTLADDVLLGSKEDHLIPITLDLRDLQMDQSPGIVCGVAARLVGGTASGISPPGPVDRALNDPSSAIEMSYLSTARAGTVMVAEEELNRAVGALTGSEGMVGSPM